MAVDAKAVDGRLKEAEVEAKEKFTAVASQIMINSIRWSYLYMLMNNFLLYINLIFEKLKS